MSTPSRDMIILGVVALVARAAAAIVVDWPAFTDPAYYSLVAQRLAEGHGFTTPVLYSFLEVGSRIPESAVLPVPSNGHWMPLTSVVAAASMAVFGPTYAAGTIPLVILSALLVPLTLRGHLGAVGLPLGGDRGRRRWRSSRDRCWSCIRAPTTSPSSAPPGRRRCTARCGRSERPRPGPWLVAAGALAGLATLARIDGVLLTVAVATAWFVRRGWSPWRSATTGGATVAWGAASAAAYLLVLAPWLLRNLSVFGAPLPSTGGHTLWIRSYNEQFSIGHEVSLATYLDWGLWNILLSKLASWWELIGRTGVLLGGTFFVFFVAGLWIFRRRAELAPFMVYFAVMFFVMGALFTFHAPKGAFYHSAPAWLPWAFGIAAAALAPAASAAGRLWPFLRRPATHRFLAVAGVAGAVVLSVIGSAILFQQWDRSRIRDEQVAAFLRANADPDDVFMASDPASIYPLTGNPGVAAPFDPFRVIEQVVDAYDVRWVVVLSPGDGEPDPLNMWDGASRHRLGGRAPIVPAR